MSDNSDHPIPSAIWRFIFPKLSVAFILRLTLIAVIAWFFFSRVCRPAWIDGESMAPEYHTGQFVFCWLPAFKDTPPQQGDVIVIRYAGQEVMLLKRVVAVEGDTVEFKNGVLLVNGKEPDAPWAHATPCNWNREQITVQPHCVFVVGDNRAMEMEQHLHGEVDIDEIAGKPL